MTTITSSSKSAGLTAMLRHDLRRTRLMSALFFLLEFIALPLQLALQLFTRSPYASYDSFAYEQVYGNLSAVLMPLVVLLAAVVLAMQLMGYNFSRRAVDVYYALPFTRRQMILSHLIAGALALAVPILINLLIAAGLALSIYPTLGLSWLAKDLLLWILLGWCVFISVIFTATLMGNAVDTILYAGMLNIEPFLCFVALMATFGSFVIGFDPSSILNRTALYLHPVPMILTRIFSNKPVSMNGWAVGIWAVLILAATALSVFFYIRRDAELAENVSRDNWFRLIFKITSAFLFATVFAYMVFGTTSAGGVYRTPSEEVTFTLAGAVGAVIGYLILEVVFGRGFKTVRGNWWICLADLVLMVGVSLLSVTGLMGYETAVPDPASVEFAEVEASNSGYWGNLPGLEQYTATITVTDPDGLKALSSLHRHAIDAATAQAAGAESGSTRLLVTYHLQGGQTVSRNYYALNLDSQGQAELVTLRSTPEALEQIVPLLSIGKDGTEFGAIEVLDLTGARQSVSDSQTQRLIEAVKSDLFRTAGEGTLQSGEPRIYLNIGYTYPLVEHYYDSVTHENGTNVVGESDYAIQLPVYESYEDTLALLTELEISGGDFDPADYIAVYGIHDHYDLRSNPSTMLLDTGLAYYWCGDVIPDSSAGMSDEALAETQSQPADAMLPGGELTDEEIRMLYNLSRPTGTDDDIMLLFDTGRRQPDSQAHLMLVRYASQEDVMALDEDLLSRITLSVEADLENGTPYLSQNNAIYLNGWPMPDEE